MPGAQQRLLPSLGRSLPLLHCEHSLRLEFSKSRWLKRARAAGKGRTEILAGSSAGSVCLLLLLLSSKGCFVLELLAPRLIMVLSCSDETSQAMAGPAGSLSDLLSSLVACLCCMLSIALSADLHACGEHGCQSAVLEDSCRVSCLNKPQPFVLGYTESMFCKVW